MLAIANLSLNRGGDFIWGSVYMCLPGLRVNLRYFVRVIDHVLCILRYRSVFFLRRCAAIMDKC